MLFTYCSVFHDKFASLRQVNSPNSQDKFQMCYTEAFGVHDFWNLNFAGFCRFLFCHSTNIMKTIKKKRNRKNGFNNGEETRRKLWSLY